MVYPNLMMILLHRGVHDNEIHPGPELLGREKIVTWGKVALPPDVPFDFAHGPGSNAVA
jgi:hypothetical protein